MKLTKKITRKFPVPGDDSAYVEIRHLSLHELRAIESSANKVTFQSKGDESHTQIELNPYARSKGIATACLTNWGGFFDDLERPIPYSKKNIEKMAEFEIGDTDFFSWVADCHDQLEDEIRADRVEAEKN
jgi:hypothetical protein